MTYKSKPGKYENTSQGNKHVWSISAQTENSAVLHSNPACNTELCYKEWNQGDCSGSWCETRMCHCSTAGIFCISVLSSLLLELPSHFASFRAPKIPAPPPFLHPHSHQHVLLVTRKKTEIKTGFQNKVYFLFIDWNNTDKLHTLRPSLELCLQIFSIAWYNCIFLQRLNQL